MELEKKYLTGVLWQNYQHTRLINLLEKLKQAKSEGQDSSVFDYAVAFLAMYVNDHFDLEKAYMEEYKYEAADDHIEEHKKFIAEIKELRNNHKKYSEEAGTVLINSISDWIIEHIMKNDIKLGKFILEKEKAKFLNDA